MLTRNICTASNGIKFSKLGKKDKDRFTLSNLGRTALLDSAATETAVAYVKVLQQMTDHLIQI